MILPPCAHLLEQSPDPVQLFGTPKLKPDFKIDRRIRPYLKSFYRMEPSKLEMGSQDWEALLNVRSIKNHIDSHTIREEFNQNTSNILSGSTVYFHPLSTCLDLSTCRGNYFSRNSNQWNQNSQNKGTVLAPL